MSIVDNGIKQALLFWMALDVVVWQRGSYAGRSYADVEHRERKRGAPMAM